MLERGWKLEMLITKHVFKRSVKFSDLYEMWMHYAPGPDGPYYRETVPQYSTEIEKAWEIVDHLHKLGLTS